MSIKRTPWGVRLWLEDVEGNRVGEAVVLRTPVSPTGYVGYSTPQAMFRESQRCGYKRRSVWLYAPPGDALREGLTP